MASAIRETYGADHSPPFSATRSSSSTIAGSFEEAVGRRTPSQRHTISLTSYVTMAQLPCSRMRPWSRTMMRSARRRLVGARVSHRTRSVQSWLPERPSEAAGQAPPQVSRLDVPAHRAGLWILLHVLQPVLADQSPRAFALGREVAAHPVVGTLIRQEQVVRTAPTGSRSLLIARPRAVQVSSSP